MMICALLPGGFFLSNPMGESRRAGSAMGRVLPDIRQRSAAERSERMAGQRQPTDVIKANGRKHMTRAEEDARRDQEIRIPVPETITAPQWLPAVRRKEFLALARQLADVNLYTALDADTLGRYVIAHHQWTVATKKVAAALRKDDLEQVTAWSRLQDLYFKQARACAVDMGLTVSSRCRLVIPEALRQAPEAPPTQRQAEDEFMARFRARQAAAGA